MLKNTPKPQLVNIMLTYSYPLVIFIFKDNGIGYQQSVGGLPKNMKFQRYRTVEYKRKSNIFAREY